VVIWTLLSLGYLMFLDSHVCTIRPTVPQGGANATLRPPSQAEVDAQISSCQAPRPNQLLVVGAGYLVIVVAGLYVTARNREVSPSP
jgi:hypothetical protein